MLGIETITFRSFKTTFLKSKIGVVVPGQPGSQILLAHQKYWLPITKRSLATAAANQSDWSVFCGFMF
jgi:hypothetical protein